MADCLFCAIVAKKIPAHIVFETGDSLAFLDINPRNPGHTLVIPKKHYETITDMPQEEAGNLGEDLKVVVDMVKSGTKAHGISVVQNNGKAAGQVVPHVHFHVIPRYLTEGPVALETVMPSKKMDDESMRSILASIKGPKGQAARPAPREEKPVEKPKTFKPPEKKDDSIIKKAKKEVDDDISFNF